MLREIGEIGDVPLVSIFSNVFKKLKTGEWWNVPNFLAIMAGEARGEDAWAGTPAYMSPEQLSGEKPTVQSDIYAFGLVLYELFTGREAYGGANIREILQQRLQSGAVAQRTGFRKQIRQYNACLGGEKAPRLT
jgi:hypothetical protein